MPSLPEELAAELTREPRILHLHDCLETEGFFLLAYVIKAILQKGRPVIILGIERPFEAYQSALRKLVVPPALLSSKVRFIPAFPTAAVAAAPFSPVSMMQELHTVLTATASVQSDEAEPASPVVILDSLTTLSGLLGDAVPGADTLSPVDAVQACSMQCSRAGASLVIYSHEDVHEDGCISLNVEHAADVSVAVRPLDTGRAMDVHGQVVITCRSGPSPDISAKRVWFSLGGNNVRFLTSVR